MTLVISPPLLIELRPQTGRTHQLRIHLSHLFHPVAGDKAYGEKADPWTSPFSPLMISISPEAILHRAGPGHPVSGRKTCEDRREGTMSSGNIFLCTTDHLEGYFIEAHCGLVSAHVASGINALRGWLLFVNILFVNIVDINISILLCYLKEMRNV